MGKLRRSLVARSGALVVSVAAVLGAEASAGEPATGTSPPLLFTPNRGQCSAQVRYQARAPGLVVSVLDDGMHVDLGDAGLRLRFAGARAAAFEGREATPGRSHFLGADRQVRGVESYARVVLVDLYPGIDLELHESQGRIEYDLVCAPGAATDGIVLALEGAEGVTLDADGGLTARVGGRAFRQLAPRAWQLGADGGSSPVSSSWRALPDGRFAFALGARDPGAPLVVDPVLVYSAYVGGSNADEACSTTVDEDGNVYVTGWARSVDFPRTEGSPPGVTRGKEAVVFKLGPDGRQLVFATYLGGRGDDEGRSIRLSADGGVIVAGVTESDDFPTTEGAFGRRAAGGADAFVLRLAPDGSGLDFATRLGGSAEDDLTAMALTPSGEITVAGTTRSRDFPVTSGVFGSEPRGGRDVFVARLDPRGERLAYATRFGGQDDDEGCALAVDQEGCAYVTGITRSHDFPTTLGAFDRERCGVDAFVVKLSTGGRTLLYSTFLGGSGQDEAHAIAVDGRHRAVVAGWTQSLDFPFDAGKSARGRKDAFVVQLSETGNGLQYATPIGGGSADEALGVALDPRGSAWVVGRTRSSDLPVTRDAHQARSGGALDGFLVQVSTEDGALLYATYVGGEGNDELVGVRSDSVGRSLVVCGSADGITQEQRGELAGRRRGPADAFVLRFDLRRSEPVTPGPVQAGLGLGF